MEITLKEYEELRIEADSHLRIMVNEGIVEIRGQEMLNEKWYTLNNLKTFLFTFQGAKIQIEGECFHYIARKSITPLIFNYFCNIKDKSSNILVLGNGRATFSSILLNFFVRLHIPVCFAEIDVSRGCIFPGSLSVTDVNELVDYRSGIPYKNIKCFFHGTTVVKNQELYYKQLEKVSDLLKDDKVNIILCNNTYDIEKIQEMLKIDSICVVGDERLFNMVNLENKHFFENTGYSKDDDIHKSINRYFNGIDNEYTPSTFIIKYNWNIMRLGEEYLAPSSALPLGAARKVEMSTASKAKLVENTVLAISEAKTEQDLATAPVAGFIVCLDAEKFKVLCTQTKLPKLNFLIQSDINYVDY